MITPFNRIPLQFDVFNSIVSSDDTKFNWRKKIRINSNLTFLKISILFNNFINWNIKYLNSINLLLYLKSFN